MAKDGYNIPFYVRKSYKKARHKRKSERLAPGYWDYFVKKSKRNDQLVKKLEKIHPEKETK